MLKTYFVGASLMLVLGCATSNRGPGDMPPESADGNALPGTQAGNSNNDVALVPPTQDIPTIPAPPHGPVTPITTPDANSVVVRPPEAIGPSLRYLGRNDGVTSLLSWPGSGVQMGFVGTQLTMQMQGVTAPTYLGVSIDGNTMAKVTITGTMPVKVGPVAQGTHQVTAIKLNESRLGDMNFLGMVTDGTPASLVVPTRRIEFIGDSITLGYGVNGNAPCINTGALEDSTAAFSTLTAQALRADYALIAWSGKGIIRNDTSDPAQAPITMPQIWQRLVASNSNVAYSFAKENAPDAVVVMLGTNDYDYVTTDSNQVQHTVRPQIDGPSFVAGYAAFLQAVQRAYPGAKILACASPMLTDIYPQPSDAQHTSLLNNIKAAVAQVGGGVTVLDLPALTDSAQKSGCGNHPSRAGHIALAQQVTATLKTMLGW
jgi:lysophospholipase L1-like esterase